MFDSVARGELGVGRGKANFLVRFAAGDGEGMLGESIGFATWECGLPGICSDSLASARNCSIWSTLLAMLFSDLEANLQFFNPALLIVSTTLKSPLRSANSRISTAARLVRGHLYQFVCGLAKERRLAIAFCYAGALSVAVSCDQSS